uniref:SMB domain-containing protein n=1 Tax=Oryzias sinensis TaxID=183150 RepID=A0A8C8DW90_9TELE
MTNSCKGRCGETFKRGRPCTCDSDCIKFKQCCPDYKTQCESEDTSQRPEVTQITTDDPEVLENVQVTTTSPSDVMIPTTIPVGITQSLNTEQNSNDVDTSAPSLAPTLEDSSRYSPELSVGTTIIPSPTNTVQDGTSDNVIPAVSTSDPLKEDLKLTKPSLSTSKPEETPEPSKLKPTSKPETKPLDTQTPKTDIQAVLCSVFFLFTGHYFWFLDRNRVPSPPQSITQVWGVPSPIDTVFTRCNCEGKTYIFKGSRYWRYDNDVLEPGYPKVIKTGLDGLRGHITAALSVPQYRSRREAVFFFKRGGFVQKYSYQAGTSRTCGRKVGNPIVTVRYRSARQAATILEPAINIRKSWKGFPFQITAAVSVPSTQEQEGYKYFVFSRSSTYNVRISGERPTIAAKENATPQSNSFFTCPKDQA